MEAIKNSDKKAKLLGAYYTDEKVAEFLLWWAIRASSDKVMDPSFGEGVFLRSACKRLKQLGGNLSKQVFGVEIDTNVYSRVSNELESQFGINGKNLIKSNFFEVDHKNLQDFDAIVGNPPFIRFHRFNGVDRNIALNRVEEQGVFLNRLSSAWAPFIVNCVSFLKTGGRLAMVVPMELLYTSYAIPILQHFYNNFRKVTLLTFTEKLFRRLNEDTLLILAENKGKKITKILWRNLPNADSLPKLQKNQKWILHGTKGIDAEAIIKGKERLVRYFIPKKAWELYQELKKSDSTIKLGELADVGIGYVTGSNDYFHLTEEEIEKMSIPHRYLRRAIRRGRGLSGLVFTNQDWQEALKTGEAGYLLLVNNSNNLPESVRQYIKFGEALGVSKKYKCRNRTPWYRVPNVYSTDGFLTYMSGKFPRIVSNKANAVSPNSLHIIRMKPFSNASIDKIVASWYSSLTQLSAEIEGHALGGGMLKLEPKEARKVIVPSCNRIGDISEIIQEMDILIRKSENSKSQEIADSLFLKDEIGLSQKECNLLRKAILVLRNRRYPRGVIA